MEYWLWKKPWLVLTGVIVLVQLFVSSSGCFPEEKASLLDFKAAYSNESLLPSWMDDPKSNCCDWERITCDSSSGHVIHLSLETLNRNRSGFARLNWSLFLSFRELRSLHLSNGRFDEFIWKGDNRSKSALKRLETLDLSHNYFNESIMEPLSSLTTLKNLNLAYNEIGGLFPSQEMSLLRNLESLDLQFNLLTGPLTAQALVNMSKLKILKLNDLSLNGSFPNQALANLSKLKVLKLNDLSLNGSFPNQGLCKMKQLEVIDLSGNYFEGVLDICLTNLTSLRTLDLSLNYLSGSIPTHLIASLSSSLESISFGGNKFEGLFSLNILANHSKLKVLQFGYMDSHTFQVETENSPWNASFQLEDLEIADCKVNLPKKTIPTFLGSQNGLRSIVLSRNNLVGMFPNWLLVNRSRLESVYLGGNSFTGPFKLPVDQNHCMDQTRWLSILNNRIQGELPQNIGFFFPYLEYLDISSNRFDGRIPSSLGEMSHLEELDLQNNNFSGKVPERIFIGCISLRWLAMDNNQLNGTLSSSIGKTNLFSLTASRNNFEGPITKEIFQPNLEVLDLSHNKFSGVLPSCSNMESLIVIRLRGNNFTGIIPEAFLVNSSGLLAIDLSDNNFTGTIPMSIYGHEDLAFLLLAGNKFQGQLHNQICQLKFIKILDLSRNNFTGSIPSCFHNISFSSPSLYRYGFVYVYRTEGLEVITKGLSLLYKGIILEDMSAFDLSSNQLTGKIPYQMGYLQGLRALNLSNNLLNGSIPESFYKLESIESLDLSNNNLSGQIPLQLQDLHSLSVFNVSYNNLSGRAPDKGQFGTFDESSYKGNPYLAYEISNRGIATTPSPPPTPLDESEKDDSAIDLTSFYWSFVASYVTVVIVLVTILWINPYWRGAWFYIVQRCLLKCFGQCLKDAFS